MTSKKKCRATARQEKLPRVKRLPIDIDSYLLDYNKIGDSPPRYWTPLKWAAIREFYTMGHFWYQLFEKARKFGTFHSSIRVWSCDRKIKGSGWAVTYSEFNQSISNGMGTVINTHEFRISAQGRASVAERWHISFGTGPAERKECWQELYWGINKLVNWPLRN